jgi:hypothetical protein
MKNCTTVILGTALFTLCSCGMNGDNANSFTSRSLFSTERGFYEAKLSPLNSHLAGDVGGSALLKLKDNLLSVEVKVNGASAQLMHGQKIHLADECPTLVADTNKDGIIDALEGMKSYGPAVIPLDQQLETQFEKETKFPVADFSGDYYYQQSVSILEMMKDLAKNDENPEDSTVKIKSRFDLEGKQVVVYGIDPLVALPESVSTLDGESKHSTLPIACGTLIKIAVPDEENTSNGGKD